jgi:hypothetical protein
MLLPSPPFDTLFRCEKLLAKPPALLTRVSLYSALLETASWGPAFGPSFTIGQREAEIIQRNSEYNTLFEESKSAQEVKPKSVWMKFLRL